MQYFAPAIGRDNLAADCAELAHRPRREAFTTGDHQRFVAPQPPRRAAGEHYPHDVHL